mgnify:CR=1 FL=1
MRYLPIPVAKKPQIRYITTPVFITYDARTSPAKLPPPSIAATYPQAEGRLSIARNGRYLKRRIMQLNTNIVYIIEPMLTIGFLLISTAFLVGGGNSSMNLFVR